MEFIKHKLGIALLILSIIVIAAAAWYLILGIPDSSFEGGILVEGIRNAGEMMRI